MRSMLTSKGEDPGDEELLGDGVAFSGVAKYPARIKCALLAGRRSPTRWPSRIDITYPNPSQRRADHHDRHGHLRTPANVADVEEALRDVVDPELGINVVDLGLDLRHHRRPEPTPSST